MSALRHGRGGAEAVRLSNAELDERLKALAAAIPPDLLNTDPGDDQWTLAENLAHIAEFSRFFADDLAAQRADEGASVGRTHEHPGRNAAIAAAKGQSLDGLRASLKLAFDALARELAELQDEHLDRMTKNRKYGPEPLERFLDRYVLGHKKAHVEQLEKTISAVQRRQERGTAG